MAALSFGVLATAKFQTDPQCFFIYWRDLARASGGPVPQSAEWSGDMVAFFATETVLPSWSLAYVLAWLLAAAVWSAAGRRGFMRSAEEIAWLLLPMVLLAVPALFWSDVPGTALWMHSHYHDGLGERPLLLQLRPRDIAAATACWAAGWLWIARNERLQSKIANPK